VILHEVLQNRSQRQWASFIEKEAEWNKFEKASELKESSQTHKSSRKTPKKPGAIVGAPEGDIFKKHREYVKTSSTTKSTSKSTTTTELIPDDNIPFAGDAKSPIKFGQPPCKITHKDSLSAIDRAKTNQCKIEIADVACRHQHDLLELTKEKTKLDVKLSAEGESKTFNNPRIINKQFTPHNNLYQILSAFKPSLLPVKVHFACPIKPEHFKPSHSDDTFLGKPYRDLDVKKVNYMTAKNSDNRLQTQEAPSVRITYLLILHGRSLRQITRMFRTIYTSHDFYILHVDARSTYLYSSLRKIFDQLALPNVIFQKNRYTPIWGGVSLLVTIKDAIRQALAELGEWDYLVNLSFADFPIEHGERLRAFLTQNQGKTFCKAHGREHEKFIKKQGLNKLFYECENRMWRLGDREIPYNMQLDGGSDWFALHRSLCEYSTSDFQDGVLDKINYWFNYTLLPAESYFHTLLKTSDRCQDLVDNNLRVTNWNRARGCKCQYKAIVDWCGCSPNDFTPYDVEKVFKQKRAVFFARKFEESVSQKPINMVHERVFGVEDKDSAWECYWESAWERDFDAGDEKKTHVFSMISEFAGVPFKLVDSVFMFKQQDNFKGYVILTDSKEYFVEIKGTNPDIKKPDTLISNSIGQVGVGSNWDVKELIFRDWGGIVTTDDKGHLSVMWHKVQSEFKVACIVVGPNGKIVTSADLTLAKGNTVITADELKLQHPYQIGVYRLLFVALESTNISEIEWDYDAEAKFVVLPGTEILNNVAEESVEMQIKNRKYHLEHVQNEMSKHGVYDEKEFQGMKDVKDLLAQRWKLEASCDRKADCRDLYWSTEFPDKKSTIIHHDLSSAEHRFKYAERMLSALP